MTDTNGNSNELFSQAAKMFQTALEAGIKVQEESTQSMTKWIDSLGSPQQWQQQAQTVMEQTINMSQQNMDEAINVLNNNTKLGMELLEQAFQARQPKTPEELQEKSRESWEMAVGSVRRNTEAIVQANSRLLQSWRDMTKILTEPTQA